jgi:hypothetical protein
MDPGIGSSLYDYDARLGYFDHHGLNCGNVRVSVDDLERCLYSEYVSGDDHGSTDANDIECGRESKFM